MMNVEMRREQACPLREGSINIVYSGIKVAGYLCLCGLIQKQDMNLQTIYTRGYAAEKSASRHSLFFSTKGPGWFADEKGDLGITTKDYLPLHIYLFCHWYFLEAHGFIRRPFSRYG
jgi:hypothetical protein